MTNILLLKAGRTVCLALVAVSMYACGTTSASFTNSPVVPAAEGSTKLKHDKNGNYALDVRVKHLARPERLTPARRVYVVWLQTVQNGITNAGQLKISNDLNGSLQAVTAFKPVKVFITAEDNASVQYPTGEAVLTSTSF